MAKVKFALGLILLVSLPGLILPTGTVIASPDEVKWSRVNTPTEGKAGNWVLANGSDAQHPTMATDGTLYCYANPSGTSYTLYKSTDGGYSWSYTGKVDDTIVDIATANVLWESQYLMFPHLSLYTLDFFTAISKHIKYHKGISLAIALWY